MGSIRNKEIANIFYEIADLLEMKEVPFKPRAYRVAAQNIENLLEDIEEYYKKGKLEEIPGIGANIAKKIKEIIETGKLEYLENLRKEFPPGIRELMKIQGLGPKTIMRLYKELNIKSIDELEKAAKLGKIRNLRGFGEKSEKNILHSIKLYKKYGGRFLLGNILPIAEKIVERLKKLPEVEKVDLAGSIRRRKETIGDVDILAVSKNSSKVMDVFTSMPEVSRVISKGDTRSTIYIMEKIQVDLRVIEKSSYGAALQYFTGSKEHNIKLRQLASEKGYKLSEYNLIDKATGKIIAGEDEVGIYKALGLEYIEPEIRENRGEIEAAMEGKLPSLVRIEDIKGDLHVHTKYSDGVNSIEEIANYAKKLGYEYIAITDHSYTLQIAKGITEDEIRKQINEINKINERMEDIYILSGIEANIDANGKIDVKNDLLKDLDYVVACIHYGFKQSEEKITERIINAMHNDYVNAIGHPTGRLINKREPYRVNLEKIFETASKLNIFLEINAYPERLDLSDINCFNGRNYNIKFVIGTDAHDISHLEFMKFGVFTARRGWLEKKDIINTLNLKDLKKIL